MGIAPREGGGVAFHRKEHAVLAIHTILYPTDFSDRAACAFGLACALARDYGARLVLLHVSPLPMLAYGEGVVMPRPPDSHDRLKAELERLEVPDAAIRVERRVEEGDPVPEILRVAEEVGADLIVLGTHGRTGLGRLLMGSVAEQVVRRGPCPVLTVRTPFHEHLSTGEVLAAPVGVGGP
jgi:nucleotide-binding universal stress UspA family protein